MRLQRLSPEKSCFQYRSSRIVQAPGADIDEIPILWIAAPLTGLIVHHADRSWKRR